MKKSDRNWLIAAGISSIVVFVSFLLPWVEMHAGNQYIEATGETMIDLGSHEGMETGNDLSVNSGRVKKGVTYPYGRETPSFMLAGAGYLAINSLGALVTLVAVLIGILRKSSRVGWVCLIFGLLGILAQLYTFIYWQTAKLDGLDPVQDFATVKFQPAFWISLLALLLIMTAGVVVSLLPRINRAQTAEAELELQQT